MKETSAQCRTHEFELASSATHPLAPPASMLYIAIVFSLHMGAHPFNIEFGGGGGTNICCQHEFVVRTCFLQPSQIHMLALRKWQASAMPPPIASPLFDRSSSALRSSSSSSSLSHPPLSSNVGESFDTNMFIAHAMQHPQFEDW